MRVLLAFCLLASSASATVPRFHGAVRVDFEGIAAESTVLTEILDGGRKRPMVAFLYDGSVYRKRILAPSLYQRIRTELAAATESLEGTPSSPYCSRWLSVHWKEKGKPKHARGCWEKLPVAVKDLWEAWHWSVAQLR